MLDYHIHTYRCCHATGTMAEYLAEAERKGLSEIGFADHFPLEMLGCTPENQVSMRADELEEYLSDVQTIRDSAAIPVKLGIEVDYLPGCEAVTGRLLAAYPFDYVIGSIHFLNNWDFTHPDQVERYKTASIDELYEEYFTVVGQLAKSGLFDIVGHLDVVKKFAFFPQRSWAGLMRETCATLAANDICVELNTSGWRAPVKEAYPSAAFLKICREMGIPVTLGSDAHCPQDVGRDLNRAVSILRDLGFTEAAVFSGRVRYGVRFNN